MIWLLPTLHVAHIHSCLGEQLSWEQIKGKRIVS